MTLTTSTIATSLTTTQLHQSVETTKTVADNNNNVVAEETSTTNSNKPLNSKKNFQNLRIDLPSLERDVFTVSTANYFSTEQHIDERDAPGNSPTTVKSADEEGTYGTHYPNRIFVGHLPGKATATDLANFFCSYGTVLEGKIVLDSFGRSRRFGFVTFATHDDVENVLSKGDLYIKGKKINVGPAVKKMFAPEFSPPATPVPTSSTPSSSQTPSKEGEELVGEQIVTVPPVNENKDSPLTKSTNVWQKVNVKRKSPPHKLPHTPVTVYSTPPNYPLTPVLTPPFHPPPFLPYDQVFTVYPGGEVFTPPPSFIRHQSTSSAPTTPHSAPITPPVFPFPPGQCFSAPPQQVMAFHNGTMYFANRGAVGVV